MVDQEIFGRIGHKHDADPRTVDQLPIVELSDDERREMQGVIDQLPQLEGGIAPDSTRFFTDVALAGQELPRRMRDQLTRFKTYGNRWGTLVLRNLPTDTDIPSTPSDGEPVHKATSYSEYGLMVPMSMMGVAVADVREKRGRFIHQVAPRPGMERAQENGGSSDFFELHTENTFLPHEQIPKYLALTCVRPGHDGGAPTLTMSVHNALPHLSEQDIAALSEPRYQFRYATSYGGGRWSEARPVLLNSAEHPQMMVDFADMATTEEGDEEGQQALQNLRSALILPKNILSVDWGPGDLVIVDNLTAVHARRGFTAQYDGQDRWLQRQMVIDPGDFRATHHLRKPGSHVFLGEQGV